MAAEDQTTDPTPTTATPTTKPPRRSRSRTAKRGSGNGRRRSTRSQHLAGRSTTRNSGSAAALSRRGKRLVEDAQNWAEEARGALPRFARNMHLPSPPSFETFTEANPVILGAVGLGIGVIIGALLPREVFHTGMQNLGLTGTTSSSSRSTRSSGRSSRSKR
jgi:hypothetical protein